jgi:cytochrome o ubiquinol oxidase subunit 2
MLARPSVEADKISYRLADPELFGKIANLEIAPGPGPQLTAKPDSGVSNVR